MTAVRLLPPGVDASLLVVWQYLAAAVFFLPLATSAVGAEAFRLSARNQEAPFCYLAGDQRSWPIARGLPAPDDRLQLQVRRAGEVVVSGPQVEIDGLKISVTEDGLLAISADQAAAASLQLDLRHIAADGRTTAQTLAIRRAPPSRPLTYLADFGDDIIRIFGDGKNGFRPIQQDGFDQYFRRLQAQGIARLIVWQSPFPYMADRHNYSAADWRRYQQQALAILQSAELQRGIKARAGFSAWGWLSQLMALRLRPEFGELLSTSASQHGIRLTASFRPFEAALTKYYLVPAFDEHGRFLWNFQPLCSPSVNYHAEETGFVHYRQILQRMGRKEQSQLTGIEFSGVEKAAALARRAQQGSRDLRIVAAPFPPLAAESFVLVRQASGSFALVRWHDVRARALAQLTELSGFQLAASSRGLRVQGLEIPADCSYLWISQPAASTAELSVSTARPALLWAAAGNRLGGENMYFAYAQPGQQPEPTRVSGIPPDGHYHTEFQATEASVAKLLDGPERTPLKDKQLVISLGADHAVEMMDFTQPAARGFAVKQLQTVLSYDAFDEIMLNTRSHTQLAGYLADDGHVVQPGTAAYRAGRRGYRQVGLDEAYAPRDAAADPRLLKLASDSATVERITTFQQGEWTAVSCQSPEPHAWRFARNRLVAAGVRQLLLDLRREFPQTRIRAVIPPRAESVERILQQLERMPGPDGKPFGRSFYRRLWCSNNHIPNIGEGMAMVDLSGTDIEPVLLGTGGYRQEPTSLRMYVDECIADLSSNRGSTFRGLRSYFYEGQHSLRGRDESDRAEARRNRESTICHLLSRKQDIGEVILYEAADWTYFLPLDDPELCGHAFLDRCE